MRVMYKSDGDAVTLYALVPGANKDTVKAEHSDGVLTVSVTRSVLGEEYEDKAYIQMSPSLVDVEKTKVEVKDGILMIPIVFREHPKTVIPVC